MGGSFLPLRFAIVFSFSVAASSSIHHRSFSSSPYSSSSHTLFPKFSSVFLSSPSPSVPKATVTDLLKLLGPEGDNSSAINPRTAEELRSCFRFLVPFKQRSSGSLSGSPPLRRLSAAGELPLRGAGDFQGTQRESQENELIWWPPPSILEAARLAFDSGGNPGVIHHLLDPTVIQVPDVEGSEENHCQLTRTPYGWKFMSEELNLYLAFLFELIASRGPAVGLDVSLDRYDLFHGHMFIARESGRLGILFHAKEYPAYDKETFPYNMGFCQNGSTVTYDKGMDLRNIVWLAPVPSDSGRSWVMPGVLVVLDANNEGIIYRDLVPDYVQCVRTLYEDDFGEVVVDVNYLNVGDSKPDFQIFIC